MKFQGELEIDETRGVVWFTPTSGKLKGRTILRLCNLPKPIKKPTPDDALLDYRWGDALEKHAKMMERLTTKTCRACAMPFPADRPQPIDGGPVCSDECFNMPAEFWVKP